jgi:hypothetical protein
MKPVRCISDILYRAFLILSIGAVLVTVPLKGQLSLQEEEPSASYQRGSTGEFSLAERENQSAGETAVANVEALARPLLLSRPPSSW